MFYHRTRECGVVIGLAILQSQANCSTCIHPVDYRMTESEGLTLLAHPGPEFGCHMVSADRKPISGVWDGTEPLAGSRAELLVRVSGP